AVAAVTKSGTNDFHGDLFEFLRNDLFNARQYFSTTQSSLKRNQYGGTVGGPIVKNKLFFFGGYQGTKLRSDPTNTQAFIPTAAMLAGDRTAFASPACNAGKPVVLKTPFVNNQINRAQYSKVAMYITTRVLATIPEQPDACGLITYGGAITKQDNWQIGNSFFSLCDAGATFFYCGNSPTWISGSTITGAFTFGSSFGGADKAHWPYWNPWSAQMNDDVSVVKGAHQVSFGGGTLYGRMIEQARFADGGQLRFNGSVTGLGLADFMTGRLFTLFQGQPNKHQANQLNLNLYATDTWKLTPRLTANL